MRKFTLILGMATMALPLTGCVSSKTFREAKADQEMWKQQAIANQNAAAAARAEAQVYRAQLNEANRETSSKDAAIMDLTSEMVRMQGQLDEVNGQYAQAMNATQSALPVELVEKLEDYAKFNSDLLEFDKTHGMVKFKADLTFAPGSAELTESAKMAVAKLADILNEPPANQYELMVAGHTDNVPVSRAATIKKGHKDNWHLSSHRAISVAEALQAKRVASSRMAVVGYADQRPVESNKTAAGRTKNRRVEVLILPSKVAFKGTPVKTPEAAKAETPETGEKTWTEDSFGWLFGDKQDATAATETGPVLNK